MDVMKTRILLVDDEHEFTSMLKAHLETAGYYEVCEENDETQALRAAREFGPDIVLLDVMMPRLEGSEVASLLRSDEELRRTPVLFLTSLISDADAPHGAYCSAGHTFLPKSLSIGHLIECIEQTLSGVSPLRIRTPATLVPDETDPTLAVS